MPPYPSNRATEEWNKLYVKGKENGSMCVHQSRMAKRQKEWDGINCQIYDYKVMYFQSSTHEVQYHPLHESLGSQPAIIESIGRAWKC